ncbi:MAG: DUF4291 domain-containing protein [Myxococcales bacterium]|nr:DUF4291 domain-containing protein [Myxococcales bacterium]
MTTRLRLAPYHQQRARWPAAGRTILAQSDADSVVVYQAYRPQIGLHTAAHGRFGGGWSRERMSWIKPNFLWMMYRCGWASKEGQEVVLALWIARAGFDEILASAVPSSYDRDGYPDRDAWQRAVHGSDVRLQWDPDHGPSGAPEPRRAIQLGLRGDALRRFADEWLLHVEDITPLVASQRANARAPYTDLLTPEEHPYPVADPATAHRLGL